jgi:prepilin-type N-terminal cleavage/methylation domain-containing protein
MKKYTEKYHHRRSPAFTMIELVLVIVVLGILAAVGIPRLERDLKQEAADNILSAIRYTQHLALIDNKHKFDNPKWQRRWWRIMFAQCSDGKYFYRIGSDDDMDSTSTFEQSEAAIDPANGKPMYVANNGDCSDGNVSQNILIGKKYGVTVGNGSGGCDGVKSIGFDHLGRPHVGFSGSNTPDYSSYMSSTCTFNFTLSDGGTFRINIEPETGYAYIDGQPDS